MKRWFALAFAIPLSACASVVNGPSRLAGQDLTAAVALYGPWAEQVELDGQINYIWRRTLIVDGTPHVCELRVQLGFRTTIRGAAMQGLPDACRLYAVREETLAK
jgi:hypothetical protein